MTEYSEDEEEEDDDEEYAQEPSPIKKFGELSSTYTKMLGSEPVQESEAYGTYEEEEDEGEDEEEHDDYEDEDEEEQPGEEDEDDDLLKRLEAKYGKISGGSRDERRVEDQDYEEEDRDDGFGSWKRNVD